jgi:hypothetical protein
VTKINNNFIFSNWFQTKVGLVLPGAFETPTFANNYTNNSKSRLQVLAVDDFNNDNYDDIVLSLVDSLHDPYILISQGDGTFKVFENFKGEAARYFLRNGEVGDLNNDGWNDFVGFESTHAGGVQKDLILINNKGIDFTVSASSEIVTSGHHGGSIGDINSDGLLDIFGIRDFGEINYSGSDIRSPLLQQADGSFLKSKISLPSLFENYAIGASKLQDLNGDDIDDIILCLTRMAKDQGGEYLSYSLLEKTPLVAFAFGKKGSDLKDWDYQFIGRHWINETTYQDFTNKFGPFADSAGAGSNSIATLDINNDNKLDIVVGSYISEGFLQRTAGFQVFINHNNEFKDETEKYFPNQLENRDFGSGLNFLYGLHDFNADGNKDFLITTSNSINWPENSKYGSYPSLFINSGAEYLPAAVKNMRVFFDNKVIGGYLISNAISGDFNGDGVPDLISIRSESDFHWGESNLEKYTGYAIVSHLNSAITNDNRTSLTEIGTNGNDILNLKSSNKYIRGLSGDDQLNGLPGRIDTAIYYGSRNDFSILKTHTIPNKIVVTDNNGLEGQDTLLDIERISFSDTSIAFDLYGNAAMVAKTLGAVFGKTTISNKEFVGIGLHYLDDLNYSYSDLIQLAINFRLGPDVGNAQVVDLLYTNVVGTLPDATTRKSFTDLLDNGTFNLVSLGVLAADTELNKTNINLIGLADTGLEYRPLT